MASCVLYHYEIDFSPLSLDEKRTLMKLIDKHSYTGIHMRPDFQSADFFFDKNFDISALNIPARCHLVRLP